MVDDIDDQFIYIPDTSSFNPKKIKSETSKPDEKRVNPIFQQPSIENKDSVNIVDQKKHEKHKHFKEEVKDHFKEMVKAVELAHKLLEKMNSPYRFCVYKKDSEIFIDVIIIDEYGDAKMMKKQNITHEEFYSLLQMIERGEGVLFDTDA